LEVFLYACRIDDLADVNSGVKLAKTTY